MRERIRKELDLIKRRFADMEHTADGSWVRIPAYPLPNGWNRSDTVVAFPVPPSYPAPPYGIYVPAGLRFGDASPKDYKEPAPTQPPFAGAWGLFSWSPDGEWRALADPEEGSNLLNWVLGFAARFREGI